MEVLSAFVVLAVPALVLVLCIWEGAAGPAAGMG